MSDRLNGHVPDVGGYEQVESLGQSWKIKWIGPGIKKAFCKWLRAQAWAVLEEDKPLPGVDTEERRAAVRAYARREDLLACRMEVGAYTWGPPIDPEGIGSAVAAALEENAAWMKLAQILMEEFHGALAPEQIDKISAGNKPAWDAAIKRCLDPNRSGPVTGQTSPASLPETPLPISISSH